jgi:hypothetical protein
MKEAPSNHVRYKPGRLRIYRRMPVEYCSDYVNISQSRINGLRISFFSPLIKNIKINIFISVDAIILLLFFN